MALAMVALLAGLWGGLLRLGLPLPGPPLPVTVSHGPLMVSAFLGTVIGLERAVALRRWWAYGVPLAAGLGGLALVTGGPGGAGALLTSAASAGLVAVFAALLRRQAALFTWVMALGAVAWLVGQGLWLAGWPVAHVAFWWAGFLVLTIAGERLELTRLAGPPGRGHAGFVAAVALLLLGLALTPLALDPGVRVAGAGLIGLTAWLARHDVARRTVRQAGLPRFVACCLLSGYAWLGLAGALALLSGGVTAGPRYDALLHAVFLGFVFVMVFGHAPIIFPAVLGWPVAYRPAFYAHVVLLHATLLLRIAGDLLVWLPGRQWGGLLNVLALLLFLANTGYGILRPADSPHRSR